MKIKIFIKLLSISSILLLLLFSCSEEVKIVELEPVTDPEPKDSVENMVCEPIEYNEWIGGTIY